MRLLAIAVTAFLMTACSGDEGLSDDDRQALDAEWNSWTVENRQLACGLISTTEGRTQAEELLAGVADEMGEDTSGDRVGLAVDYVAASKC